MIYPPEYVGEKPSTKQAAAEQQFEAMRDVIDIIEPAAILDIGCGFGFIDVLIAQNAPVAEIHLLDGDGTGQQDGGYKHTMHPWSNVAVAAAIVRANVPDAAVHAWHPGDMIEAEVDLVISCRAWGHHFPIEAYLDLARVTIRDGGHIITDIRNGTDGASVLHANGFKQIARIPDPSLKCKRWLFERVV